MCASPVIIEDFFATIHEVTGVPLESAVDGRSFVPLLRGRTAPARDLIWHQPNNWVGDRGPGLGPHSSLRSGDWKLIYYHEPSRAERFELFDLAHDIGEEHNLAQREPERLAQLRTRLADALRECDAQMPVDRERDAPVRWPDADL
jgi:arylsulfatase A-like enzyme